MTPCMLCAREARRFLDDVFERGECVCPRDVATLTQPAQPGESFADADARAMAAFDAASDVVLSLLALPAVLRVLKQLTNARRAAGPRLYTARDDAGMLRMSLHPFDDGGAAVDVGDWKPSAHRVVFQSGNSWWSSGFGSDCTPPLHFADDAAAIEWLLDGEPAPIINTSDVDTGAHR